MLRLIVVRRKPSARDRRGKAGEIVIMGKYLSNSLMAFVASGHGSVSNHERNG